MAKIAIDCPECGEKCKITHGTTSPVQCCPFCGNTLLLAPDDEDDYDSGDDLTEFDPDDQ